MVPSINDAVQDALASGILELHVLGWAFEANVGEVKSQLEKRGKVKVELALARGRRSYDKRQNLARRDAEREIERAVGRARKGRRD